MGIKRTAGARKARPTNTVTEVFMDDSIAAIGGNLDWRLGRGLLGHEVETVLPLCKRSGKNSDSQP